MKDPSHAERETASRSIAPRHLWLLVGLAALSPAVHGAACTVPAGYPSLDAAVADPACTEIDLQSGTFSEEVTIGRDLVVRGAGTAATTLVGRVAIEGAGVLVVLEDLTIDVDGCFGAAILVSAAGQAAPDRVEVIDSGTTTSCLLFRDDFETGDVSRWSASAP